MIVNKEVMSDSMFRINLTEGEGSKSSSGEEVRGIEDRSRGFGFFHPSVGLTGRAREAEHGLGAWWPGRSGSARSLSW